MSPKSVLEPATKLVFRGKWLGLLERMVWSHEVAHLQMLVACLRLPVWALAETAYAVFFGLSSLAGKTSRPGWAYPCGASWSPLLCRRPWLLSRGARPWLASKPCVLSSGCTDLTLSCWGGGGKG